MAPDGSTRCTPCTRKEFLAQIDGAGLFATTSEGGEIRKIAGASIQDIFSKPCNFGIGPLSDEEESGLAGPPGPPRAPQWDLCGE